MEGQGSKFRDQPPTVVYMYMYVLNHLQCQTTQYYISYICDVDLASIPIGPVVDEHIHQEPGYEANTHCTYSLSKQGHGLLL